eukprot:CAMPEP_0116875616 /NCGR_PEP_ID=MMETSP0463-20121206/7651_1 /TAXON_ID=181622 /ORGANISM="Strombidinopsis sp, Strain SopsisLIS2011" /LENGTH=150 /DNA_ID=CAMNT_0004521585 /DNA_START=797 /DNA_END=1249 /DNA_ORIENTATION=-
MVKDTAEAILRGGVITVGTTANTIKGYAGASMGIGSGGVKHVAGAVTRALPWMFTGVVLTAKTGLDYRSLKKGKIDKREFRKRLRTNTVTGVLGLGAASIGATAGFTIGTVIIPGIGSAVGGVVGTLVGAISVGFIGKKYAEKGYSKIED